MLLRRLCGLWDVDGRVGAYEGRRGLVEEDRVSGDWVSVENGEEAAKLTGA